jgi:hypothetical protein
VSDIRKAKDMFQDFVLMRDADAPNKPRKHMKMAQEFSYRRYFTDIWI